MFESLRVQSGIKLLGL